MNNSSIYKKHILKDYNFAVYLFNQIFGWSQFSCWCFAMFFIVIEVFRRKTTQGLSKDFVSMVVLGFVCLNFQDIFGYYGNSSFKNEVHISDLILSFIGCNFGFMCVIMLYTIPNTIILP